LFNIEIINFITKQTGCFFVDALFSLQLAFMRGIAAVSFIALIKNHVDRANEPQSLPLHGDTQRNQ
jgi:hypothetical protein